MIIGTAGHIDHGKTALVKALTEFDGDRLKEKKARGIYWLRVSPHSSSLNELINKVSSREDGVKKGSQSAASAASGKPSMLLGTAIWSIHARP